ncbi:MAG: hypothetical protein H7Z74_13970 [Anaerolineae bacterium]|nr:hypothetical protein [Gemmatimonadaceae bacterium]
MKGRPMCIDGMGLVDLAVSRLIPVPSQWPEFFSWAKAAFALEDDSWDPAGAGEPWRGSLPYGKTIASIYLLAYAIRDEYIPQWHARGDYLAAARAMPNPYHGPFYIRFMNNSGGSEAHSDTGRTAARDRTDMYCPVFDLGGKSDDPVNRASVLVHEAWHHWQYHKGYQSGHLGGGAIDPSVEGDYYYPHGTGDFDFGQLWKFSLSPLRFHSPYQVQVEFSADLAEFSFHWVPVAATQSARYYGNTRLAMQFHNRVNYRIGQPRPF